MSDSAPHFTIGHVRLTVSALFKDCGVPDAPLEADRIVCLAAGVTRAELHAHPERIMERDAFARSIEFSIRRAGGEPLAYIEGSSLFCGRSFKTDRRVLIPRTETEILTRMAIDAAREIGPEGLCADWCAGSGCIAVTLLAEMPGWRALAVDISPDALDVARENAARHGVADRMTTLICGDPSELADAIEPRSLDLIVSDPPYIPTGEIEGLETQVRGFEPMAALDGGPDGLDIVRMLLDGTARYAKDGAALMLETAGREQTERVRELSTGRTESGWRFERPAPDHRGIERFALLRAEHPGRG